jgi:hypothetical protein
VEHKVFAGLRFCPDDDAEATQRMLGVAASRTSVASSIEQRVRGS